MSTKHGPYKFPKSGGGAVEEFFDLLFLERADLDDYMVLTMCLISNTTIGIFKVYPL
jgi:hypothetical protein